jgi:lambda family phage tail tape measure protein
MMNLSETKLSTAELRRDLESLNGLGQAFGTTMSRAFASAVTDGRKLSDVLRSLMLSLSRQTLTSALQPLSSAFGALLGKNTSSAFGALLGKNTGGTFGAMLGKFAGGLGLSKPVVPFAKGGIVGSPTLFPLAGGMGLMGESGAEAIMPLARDSDGRLGVRTSASRSVHVTFNISTPDIDGFKRSQSQISAAILRTIERGQRNL